MSDLKDAVTKVKNLGGLFRAVMVISDEIDKVEKLDQLTSESNARLSAAQADHDKFMALADAERKSADAASKRMHNDLALAQSDADAARNEAKRILDDAKAKAASAIDVAKDKSNALIADAEAKKATAERAANASQLLLDDTEKAIAARQDELKVVEAKIEAAREAVKKMMGG